MSKRTAHVLALFTACACLITFMNASWLHAPSSKGACGVAADMLRASRASTGPPLPKIIHQQWKTAVVPTEFRAWSDAFSWLFPSHERVLWTDESMRALIETKYSWFLQTYDEYPKGIQRADAFRCFVLYEFGGLYADLDYDPRADFWDYLPRDVPSFVESPYTYSEGVQNSLMSSPKGHPFWNVTFELLMERAKEPKRHVGGGDVLYTTGPVMLDGAIARYEGRTGLLPCELFQRIPLGEAGNAAGWTLTSIRYAAAHTKYVKQCGDVSDPECLFGVHHNVVTWLISLP